MDAKEIDDKFAITVPSCSTTEDTFSKNKQRNRGRKRKRRYSSSDNEIILPDNTLETERNVHASAVRNNLDDTSVRKILKKVVTNDHVLALVQLREEEEGDSGSEDKSVQPKLTRAKAKALKKGSPRSAPWNLQNLELTPINHIPVKTRPEVKALIAQELTEDEDDEEYEPTHDDVPSDDDHDHSCSDLDSQPRTPVTPAQCTPSPKVIKDGPFKVPQEISARRKLIIDEEEATIALRTRSKLSLSTTTIEHIESSFVPPDDVQPPVDNLWSQFLSDCLDPAPPHEEDDDADPEYNAAADAEALDEDEDILASSLIKISKKELNDLVTELFNVMPATVDEDLTLENLANSVLTDTTQTELRSRWEGKTEPLSDEEGTMRPSKRLKFEKGNSVTPFSVGKSETYDVPAPSTQSTNHIPCGRIEPMSTRSSFKAKEMATIPVKSGKDIITASSEPRSPNGVLHICIEERDSTSDDVQGVPPSLRSQVELKTETVHIQVETGDVFTPEQVLILQQQLRMHIQLATSNFLQLFVHPVQWRLGPTYMDYLETLHKLSQANENSVVNVCNLKPAMELVKNWEESVSKDTPENVQMVKFINEQVERCRRRYAQNCLYVGDFHDTFKRLVANSPVFLYPYLLPAVPYKADHTKRVVYLRSEDQLIVLGLDQFWKYIEDNKAFFKPPKSYNSRHRWGLATALQLVSKHMLPWITPKQLATHVTNMRGMRSYTDKHNPIYNYFNNNEVTPVQHSILPFNPELTLYDQPEHEMPRLWARYLAKSSKRFKNYINRRHHVTGNVPTGVPVASATADTTLKRPLPHDFTKTIKCTRNPKDPMTDEKETSNVQKPEEIPLNMYRLVNTSNGSFLIPLEIVTIDDTSTVSNSTVTKPLDRNVTDENKVIFTTGTVTTPVESKSKRKTKFVIRYNTTDHCSCCISLRKMVKKQTVITDFFCNKANDRKCYCSDISYPKVTNKLKLLANNFKNHSGLVYKDLERRLEDVKTGKVRNGTGLGEYTLDELVSVTTFQLKVVSRSLMSKFSYLKVRCKNLLSKFNADTGDPIRLANALFKTCGKEMVDLYFDFLEFLTTEQADKLNKFKDYFVRNCAKNLMDKVEEQVRDKETRTKILSQLQNVFGDSDSTSCEICTDLLECMSGYDALAKYTFSLFPHRKEARVPPCPDESTGGSETAPVAHIKITQSEELRDIEEETESAMEYESDCSGDEVIKEKDTAKLPEPQIPDVDTETPTKIKVEPEAMYIEDVQICAKQPSPTNSFIITLEEEMIKEEPAEHCEWKRGEDKLILEVLKQQLTPKERRDKTIAEIMEEKNVLGLISQRISQKTKEEVKKRVMFILSLLVLSES